MDETPYDKYYYGQQALEEKKATIEKFFKVTLADGKWPKV